METKVQKGDVSSELMQVIYQAGRFAVDIETGGLQWSTDKVGAVILYVPGNGVEIVHQLDSSPDNLREIMQNDNLIKTLHHAPFDLRFLYHDYGIMANTVRDTKVAAKILDPSKTWIKSYSLQALVDQFLCIHIPKGQALSNWFADELTPEQVTYAKDDVIHLHNLLYVLEKQLGDKIAYAQAAYKFLPMYAEMEVQGITNVYGH